MVENINIGDYVLIHTGFAIQKLDEKEALETLSIFDEFRDFNERLDEEEQSSGERII